MALPILAALLPVVSGIIDKIIPDKKAASNARAKLVLLEATGDLEVAAKQLEVNMQEAKHSSIFVAGWRPFVGWVCASAFAYHFILYPILLMIFTLNGVDMSVLPKFDISMLVTVLGGLLGLGSLRTYEKRKGIAAK